MTEEKAEEIFSLIVKFGGYGFNKSHSAAYALVSYQTAYLKQHYPAEFMAALLSSEIEDGNKRDMLIDHIGDARKFGVQVLPPDVNRGEADFTVVQRPNRLRPDRDQGPWPRRRGEHRAGSRGERRLSATSSISASASIRASSARRPSTSSSRPARMDAFAQPFAHRAQLIAALPRNRFRR